LVQKTIERSDLLLEHLPILRAEPSRRRVDQRAAVASRLGERMQAAWGDSDERGARVVGIDAAYGERGQLLIRCGYGGRPGGSTA
jgi:hypothetical protein